MQWLTVFERLHKDHREKCLKILKLSIGAPFTCDNRITSPSAFSTCHCLNTSCLKLKIAFPQLIKCRQFAAMGQLIFLVEKVYVHIILIVL